MNSGFYLNELVLKGENKTDASILFSRGINVIDGASDTGKSFIYECIDYMLGATTKPKNIDEAKGYNELYLEIHSDSDGIITLHRKLDNSEIYYSSKSISDSVTKDFRKILSQHSKKNPSNISTLLLNISGIKYKDIIVNKNNITESFTYRGLSRLNMLSEEKIITKESPINDNGNYTITKYKSVLRAVLTGRDDANYKNNKKNKVSATRIEGQLDLIEQLKQSENEKLSMINQHFDNNIQSLIDELENITQDKKNQLMNCEEEHKNIYDEKILLSNEAARDQKLLNRFKLLKKNYKSDIERLDFIEESQFYLNQMADIKCPICESDWDSNTNSIEEISQTEKAILSEKNKIELQIIDLDQTMHDINNRIEVSNLRITELNDSLGEIQENIHENLKPIIEINEGMIKSLVDKQVEQIEYQKLEERINELDELYDKTKNKLNEVKVNNSSEKHISDSILDDFTSIVNDILIGVKFYSKGKVEFSRNDLDLIINGKTKETFGKGSRAIINATYLLGILKYTEKNNLNHPNFVILDSPLTTYKKKDLNIEDIQEIPENVKANFYKYLSNHFNNNQVIIFDNVEPPELVKSKINYIHFTGNPSISRSGFVPLQK